MATRGDEPLVPRGAFVRVKPTSENRAGQDGMAVKASEGATVALVFGLDRYNRPQPRLVETGLVETWNFDELDLRSVQR